MRTSDGIRLALSNFEECSSEEGGGKFCMKP